MICKDCKTEIEWRLHDCKRSISEYLGCEKCDNWCVACRPNWNAELNGMHESKEDKESKELNKDVQKKQRKSRKKT